MMNYMMTGMPLDELLLELLRSRPIVRWLDLGNFVSGHWLRHHLPWLDPVGNFVQALPKQ